jgi:hypothetical protein
VNSWFDVVLNRVDNMLDSESIWRNFRNDVIAHKSREAGRRYVRLNPKIRFRTPKMDDSEQFQKLHNEAKARLETHGMRVQITMVARQLVASSFYFEKSVGLTEANGQFAVLGK